MSSTHVRIVSTTRFPGDAFERLSGEYEVRVAADLLALGATEPDYCRTVDVIAVGPGVRIDAARLDPFPRVRLISSYGIGLDHVDLDAATARGIGVCNTLGVVEKVAAEAAVGLMIGLVRRLREGDALIRSGSWPEPGLESMLGVGLDGALLGIVGLGRTGRETARISRALGMRIAYSQRVRAPLELEQQLEARYLGLDELLGVADVVSLHCPLTPETRHLIDARALGLMKPGAFLINTARGPVVDEEAVVDALRRGVIAGAGLDVFEHEPQVHPGLRDLPNVFLAPHLGGATVHARRGMTAVLVEQVEQHVAGVRPRFLANQPAGWSPGVADRDLPTGS